MKIPKIAVLVCIVLILFHDLNGQDKVVHEGYNKLFYPNGKVSSEGFMRDGQPDGYWKTYFPTGVIKSEGNRKNHLLDSIWVFYNESGDTLQKVNYIMGKRNGYTLGYNVNHGQDPMNRGRIISQELYVNDKREGLSMYYFSNGLIREEVLFTGQKRHGISREYNEEGVLITIQRFNNGVLVERERINRTDAGDLKQGVWKTFYSNGRIKSESNYRDDLMEGPFKEYDENGNLQVILQYAKGILLEKVDTAEMDIEIRDQMDAEGNIIYSGSYRENIPVGIHRMFEKGGSVINAYLYNDEGIKIGEGIITLEGRREGDWQYFFSDGSVRARGKFVNNLELGTWNYFYRNGRNEQTGPFKNGKINGSWKWFYESGELKREEEYFEGKEEGVSVEYDTLGEIITSGSYFDGLKEGEWFYKAGDYSEKGKYVGDLKDGKWLAFYSDGTLKYEGNFIQGNPDGEHVFYYKNGRMKETNFYIMGLSERNLKKYDENGQLLISITYKNNREYRINGEKVDFAVSDVKLIE
jgi:antitoxin component YwqK of YwqJK toxin-antitoxin module